MLVHFVYIIWNWKNTQVPPRPMPEIPETTYTILRSYYPPELILCVIFYPFLAYVALVQKKSQPSLGPQDSVT